MEEKVLAIVNTVLQNRGRAVVSGLNAAQDLRKDLGLDSLDLAELTVRVETEFDVDIFADGLVATVGEIYAKLA